MSVAPLELMVIGFRGDAFLERIAPELERLRNDGTLAIADIVVTAKDSAGNISATELEDVGSAVATEHPVLAANLRRLLTEEDVANVALELPRDSQALVLLVEHVWAASLKQMIEGNGGALLGDEHIGPEIVQELVQELHSQGARTAKPARDGDT